MGELICKKHGDDTSKPKSLCWNCYLDLVKDQKQKLEVSQAEIKALRGLLKKARKSMYRATDVLSRHHPIDSDRHFDETWPATNIFEVIDEIDVALGSEDDE